MLALSPALLAENRLDQRLFHVGVHHVHMVLSLEVRWNTNGTLDEPSFTLNGDGVLQKREAAQRARVTSAT